MGLKKHECPNCGANLKFNNVSHSYECQYCDSRFKDTKADAKGDARVELSPEDLELLKPVSNKTMGKQDMDKAVKILAIVFAILFIAPTFFAIIAIMFTFFI